MKSVGELSKVCSQIVLKCLYLARIGRPDMVSEQTCTIKACDQRFKTEVCTCSQFPTEAMQWMARGMGSPRHVHNRRRRTREGPEPACVQTPSGTRGGARRGGKYESTSCRGTV